jgi:hypothetical protein
MGTGRHRCERQDAQKKGPAHLGFNDTGFSTSSAGSETTPRRLSAPNVRVSCRVRQQQPRRQHRQGARVARRAGPLRTARHTRGPSGRRTTHAATTMPLLRRTHVYHRDLRARMSAEASSHKCCGSDQDRHLLMPSSLIHHRTDTRHSGRLSTGGAPNCVDTPDGPETASPIASPNRPFTRSCPRAHPTFEPNRPARPLRPYLPARHPEAKCP